MAAGQGARAPGRPAQAASPARAAAGGGPRPPATARPPLAVLLRVEPQNQFPQLPNGCEVTSLSMLLGAVGHPVSKMRLARLMPVDPTPRRLGAGGQILAWGDPNVGFVGSVYVHADGFGMYHGPVVRLIDRLLPGRGLDLTGRPFDSLLARVAAGQPVEVWTTVPLSPDVPWVTWQSPEGPVHTTLEEHAVLLVGYTPSKVLIANPFNGEAAQSVPRARFIASWQVMGRQAVTVAGARVPAQDRCVGRLSACRLPPASGGQAGRRQA
ncbi:MAG: C39 family peptidase [Firmicutes bacterium]|nr:C39 family peptidase [Bacillota bacterium]